MCSARLQVLKMSWTALTNCDNQFECISQKSMFLRGKILYGTKRGTKRGKILYGTFTM